MTDQENTERQETRVVETTREMEETTEPVTETPADDEPKGEGDDEA